MDQPIERAQKGLGTLGGPNAIPAATAMAACEMIKGTIISLCEICSYALGNLLRRLDDEPIKKEAIGIPSIAHWVGLNT